MHATYYMLKHAGYKKNFSSLIQLGMLIAAYCHDVDHRGHNNAFEVASKSQVAILYHDKSVNSLYFGLFTECINRLGPREPPCSCHLQYPSETSNEHLFQPFWRPVERYPQVNNLLHLSHRYERAFRYDRQTSSAN